MILLNEKTHEKNTTHIKVPARIKIEVEVLKKTELLPFLTAGCPA